MCGYLQSIVACCYIFISWSVEPWQFYWQNCVVALAGQVAWMKWYSSSVSWETVYRWRRSDLEWKSTSFSSFQEKEEFFWNWSWTAFEVLVLKIGFMQDGGMCTSDYVDFATFLLSNSLRLSILLLLPHSWLIRPHFSNSNIIFLSTAESWCFFSVVIGVLVFSGATSIFAVRIDCCLLTLS